MRPTDPWPALKVDDWADTRDTLQMWLQIVGKIQLVSTALVPLGIRRRPASTHPPARPWPATGDAPHIHDPVKLTI